MYILESGRVEVLIGGTQAPRRFRTLGPGAFIGEISYYCGGRRTTSVRAITPARLWRFSSEAAERVLSENPALAGRFHAAIATKLAERVKANTRLIQMLSV
jgi:CRP-like cAMP-binding protein